MDTEFKLKGFEDLDKALGKFSERTERQLALNSLRAGGRVVIKNAKQNAPEGLTGALKKSFMSKAGRYRPGNAIQLIVGTKGGKDFAWWAHMVEFGTASARAKPFFRPAFDENHIAIVEAVGIAMRKQILTATRKARQ